MGDVASMTNFAMRHLFYSIRNPYNTNSYYEESDRGQTITAQKND